MNNVRSFLNLLGMRRRSGASWSASARWAAGLLYRNHQASKQRQRM